MFSTEELIEIIKNNPILYDLSHKEYKNVRKRDKVWEEIGKSLMVNGEEVKKKWKNLRDSYMKYLKATKTSTGQSAKKNYKNWQWSNQMEAFRPFLAFAKTDSNVQASVEIINPTDDDQFVTQNIDEGSSELDIVDTQFESSNKENEPLEDNLIASITPTSSTLKSNKRNSSGTSSVDEVLEYLQNKKKKMHSESIDKSQLNPTELIFVGYAQMLQTFSPTRQAKTKLKIAQIMVEQECEHNLKTNVSPLIPTENIELLTFPGTTLMNESMSTAAIDNPIEVLDYSQSTATYFTLLSTLLSQIDNTYFSYCIRVWCHKLN